MVATVQSARARRLGGWIALGAPCLALAGACTLTHPLGGYEGGPARDAGAADAPPEGDGRGAAYRDEVMSDRPAHYFRFEERAGETARDETGNAAGAYRAVTLGVPGAVAGEDGAAARFVTNASAVVVGDTFDIVTGDPFTLEVWAKPDVVDVTYRRMLTKRRLGDGIDEGWSLVLNTEHGLGFEAHAGGRVTGANTGALLATGAYHHVVITYGAGALRFYVDAALIHESIQEVRLADNDAALVVGSLSSADGNVWRGDLDEIALYAHALPLERIERHFHAARGR